MAMRRSQVSYITDHKKKFSDLRHHIENQDQLKRQANGRNSIIFSYSPEEEHLYIREAINELSGIACLIDISKLMVKIIDEDGWESFKDYYMEFIKTPNLVFHSDDPATDLFDLIIDEINGACMSGKIPILIRTGCLYGTGIDNSNIIENPSVMKLSLPLVIFYPSKHEDDNLIFLNFKPASKYRCVLVE